MSRAKASGKRHGKKEMRKYAALPCRTVQRVFLRRRRGGKDLRNLVKNAEFHQDAFEERAHFSTKICPVRENVKLCLLLLYYGFVVRLICDTKMQKSSEKRLLDAAQVRPVPHFFVVAIFHGQ